MYRSGDIKKGLSGLIGWRQYFNPSEFKIEESLTRSETGRYFQDFHPLLTLDNIRAIAPDFDEIKSPEWSADTDYIQGYVVSISEERYRAVESNKNKPPKDSPEEWMKIDLFSEWLSEKTQGSILKAMSSLWDDKIANRTGKNVLENRTLFNGSGRITDREKTGNNLVGFEIIPIRANGVTLHINKIGLQFSEIGAIDLFLCHSSQVNPIKKISLERTKPGSMEWFDVNDLFLPYSGPDIDSGGSWYLVYDQDSLGTNQAIIKNRDWSAKPCYGCNADEISSYRVWSQYLEVHPFKNSDFQNDPELVLWDVSKNLYTYSTNYGINLQISLECDSTDILIEQRRSLQNVLGLQVAIDFLREMAYNPNANINRKQQNTSFSKPEILYELDGDSQGYKKSGLMNQLNVAMKAVSIDLTNISKVCFPCNNRGLRFRTV